MLSECIQPNFKEDILRLLEGHCVLDNFKEKLCKNIEIVKCFLVVKYLEDFY